MAQIMQGLVEELGWYKTVMAENGYSGPAGDAVNPLREMLRDRVEMKLDHEGEITLMLGAVFHAARLAGGGDPRTDLSISNAKDFLADAKALLR